MTFNKLARRVGLLVVRADLTVTALGMRITVQTVRKTAQWAREAGDYEQALDFERTARRIEGNLVEVEKTYDKTRALCSS